jgi:hypothetical protein
MVKKVNDYCLPVLYSDIFYRELLELGDLCKLAYCNDIVVGAVTGSSASVRERGGGGDGEAPQRDESGDTDAVPGVGLS